MLTKSMINYNNKFYLHNEGRKMSIGWPEIGLGMDDVATVTSPPVLPRNGGELEKWTWVRECVYYHIDYINYAFNGDPFAHKGWHNEEAVE